MIRLTSLVALLGVTLLTGCGEKEVEEEENIRREVEEEETIGKEDEE